MHGFGSAYVRGTFLDFSGAATATAGQGKREFMQQAAGKVGAWRLP